MRFAFSAQELPAMAADLLIVGVPAGGLAAALATLDAAYGGALTTLAADDEFSGKSGSSLGTPGLGRIAAKKLLLIGVGAGGLADIRTASGTAGFQSRTRGAKNVVIAFPGAALGAVEIRAVAEAFAEGNYRFDKYKSAASKKAAAESLTFAGVTEDKDAVARATALISGQNLARDLVNEPASEIYPESLANIAASLASERISVTVLDEVAIAEKGMGGITGVGQGSDRKPRFVHMTYTPAGPAKGHICFVGKGVTFDSGGLSIKPTDGMMTMRCDMAGSAAVIGAMKAIAALQPNVKVTGIFGAVENMLSGNSYKLGDLLKMYNGKRVEINNTDAEGRLVLGDCLSYASDLKPDAIVDLATLTGAAVIALGDWYNVLYSRSDELAATLTTHAHASGEGIWRLPLAEIYKDKIKSEWGDLKNSGGRVAGSITAALFLSEFVTVEKWAHIDIAGPAFMDSSFLHFAQGGTGTMVRTLARWAESYG